MAKSLNFNKFQWGVQTFLAYDFSQFLDLTHLSTKDKTISLCQTFLDTHRGNLITLK
jgi:hypothetical protein